MMENQAQQAQQARQGIFLADPLRASTALPPDVTDDTIVTEVSEREWTVDVGQTATCQLTIVNGGELVAQFKVEIRGLDPEWVILAPPEVRLNERARQMVNIFITPPRSPSSRAGTHLLSIVVSSPTYPGHESRTGASLTINPYYAFTVGELSPRRQTISWPHESGRVTIDIANQGNSEAIFRLDADDDEQACHFQFQVSDEDASLVKQAQLVLSPKSDSDQSDGAATLGVVVTPRSRRLVALRSRTHRFAVNVSPGAGWETPRSVMGQLESKPLIGPGLLALLVLLVVGLVLTVGWPRIRKGGFDVEPRVVDAGESVTITWRVSPFVTDVWIEGEGLEEGAFSSPEGEETIFPSGHIAVYTLRTDNLLSRLISIPRGKGREQRVGVLVRPLAPVIHAFVVDKRTVARGEPVVVKWSVSHADELILRAGDFVETLAPEEQVGQRVITVDGDTLISLQARSLSGADLESVLIWHQSPTIHAFQVSPSHIAAGESVTITWRVDGVDSVAITPFPGLYPPQDSIVDAPSKNTKYVLTASAGDEKVIATWQVIVEAPALGRE